MEAIWRIDSCIDKREIDSIADRLGINKVIASVLINRGINTVEKVDHFLNPKLQYLHSPKYMKDMDKGTDIIIDAIKQKKKIVIYGDYDCDGVTSTTIMYKGLLRCGAHVSYHIPDRVEEGYGMNSDTVSKLCHEGFQVIVTCDNGISCAEQVSIAKSLGMQVVITDHHEVPFVINENGNREDMLPEADAVINPKRHDCPYPFKNLCGAGVAFKFVHTLYYKLGIATKELYDFIELAAIGTICDVVDLVDENRVITALGLRMLNSTRNMGLRALIKEIGYEGKKVRAWNVGYQIGPCINATGRLDSARLSVELLMCRDSKRALELARELRRLNQDRQTLTDSALREIIEQIEKSDIKNDRVLVIYKENLHESLAGIIAGKLRERYNKPTLVATMAKDRVKGSGRSIEEYNMFEELCKVKDILQGVGGHPMAAGFSLVKENIPLLRNRLNELCSLTDEDMVCKIDVDGVIKIEDINFELVESIEKLEPFGKGNREPLFMIEDLIIDKIVLMGQNNEHMKLLCRDIESSTAIPAISFHGADRLRETLSQVYGHDKVGEIMQDPGSVNLKMDLLFKPSINKWNNTKYLQMMLVDYNIK